MKKYMPLLAASLLFSLFIYVFYRTEKTLVNQCIIVLFSQEHYSAVKNSIVSALPLGDYFIYSLPEGLWVFCITITSSFFYIEAVRYKFRLVFVPILVAVVMEFLQLYHVLNGSFDVVDIIFSCVFWLLALVLTGSQRDLDTESLFRSLNGKTICCITTYSVVYLAHVVY